MYLYMLCVLFDVLADEKQLLALYPSSIRDDRQTINHLMLQKNIFTGDVSFIFPFFCFSKSKECTLNAGKMPSFTPLML